MIDREFWNGRRVLLTGHTGFKGAWAALLLRRLGAEVDGIALAPDSSPNLYDLARPLDAARSRIVDVRDRAGLRRSVSEARPGIVIHMAAQALVRRSYREPAETVATNVQGTVNLLEALRESRQPPSAILVVTSDKVYRNDEAQGDEAQTDEAQAGEDRVALAESAPLGGDDPYSASKAAAEILTRSWARSFFDGAGLPLATARAGNVLGGGDFSEDRLVPDVWRAVQSNRDLVLRYPDATRPWQHVLDLMAGYLAYVQCLCGPVAAELPRSLNFGPSEDQGMAVRTVAEAMFEALGEAPRISTEKPDLTEKLALAIDSRLARRVLGWSPVLGMEDTLAWTALWYQKFRSGADPKSISLRQIDRYFEMTSTG